VQKRRCEARSPPGGGRGRHVTKKIPFFVWSNSPYCGHFDNKRKHLLIIYTILLGKASNDQSSFESFKGPIRPELYFVYPFTRNSLLAWRKVHKVPCMVYDQSINFLIHSLNSSWIFCSFFIVLRFLIM